MRRKVPPNAQLVVDSDRFRSEHFLGALWGIWNFYISLHNPFLKRATGFCGFSPLLFNFVWISYFILDFGVLWLLNGKRSNTRKIRSQSFAFACPQTILMLIQVGGTTLGSPKGGAPALWNKARVYRIPETLRQRCVFGRLWPKIKLAFWVFYCMDTSFKQSTKRLIKCKIIQMGQPTAKVYPCFVRGAGVQGAKKYVHKHAHLARDHQFLVRNCRMRTVSIQLPGSASSGHFLGILHTPQSCSRTGGKLFGLICDR